jgi:hypothetical protein
VRFVPAVVGTVEPAIEIHRKLELEAHPVQHVITTDNRADRLALKCVASLGSFPLIMGQTAQHVHCHRISAGAEFSRT